MTEGERQKECERICGEAGKRGMHRLAPELCPVKEQEWLGQVKKQYSLLR